MSDLRFEEPTKASIRELAEWFDDPNRSPLIVLEHLPATVTAGMVLRRLADEMGVCVAAEEAEDMNRTSAQVYQDDLKEIMEALGMPTHARPRSPHRVAQEEVIPWAMNLMERNRRLEKFVKKLGRESSDLLICTGSWYSRPSTEEAEDE